MKKILSLVCLFGTLCFATAKNITDSLLQVFDHELTHYQTYINARQQRINYLKQQFGTSLSNERLYRLYQELYKEYRPYQSDSALYYLNCALTLGEQLGNTLWINEASITSAYLLASTGFYKEATDLLASIERSTLQESLIIAYYDCIEHVYGEASFYGKNEEMRNKYRLTANLYYDSLAQKLAYGSDRYLEMQEQHYQDLYQYDEALKISDLRLAQMQSETPEYAMTAYQRSQIYKKYRRTESEKEWLIRSAICDLRLGITDNGSSWQLAGLMYAENDLTRAYNYINYSMENSNTYNARLRQMQIGSIQSIINNAYQASRKEQANKLRLYLILISILTVLLLAAAIGILCQNKKLSTAHAKTKFANTQLNELNFELDRINKELKDKNLDLLESNHVKEEYIGHFLILCSSYIDKMDEYRRQISKRLSLGHTDEVLRTVRMPGFMENEVKAFYVNFDTTFLHLYPDFVKEFNDLLQDKERIVLKKGELLNTELRIFALIRLGIDNSAKIAELLRYSSNTIYNYRAKIKNKAKGTRNDFENLVMRIGTFTK